MATRERQSKKLEEVMQYIKSQITNGTWKEGDYIASENELCAILNVSRTSVRAAIERYKILGVLESQHGKGTFVKSTAIYLPSDEGSDVPATSQDSQETLNSYREWRQARNIVEPELAAQCAKKATPEFIQKLEKINQEQRAAVGNQEQFIECDKRFHMAFAEFLGNQLIIDFMAALMSDMKMHLTGNHEFGYVGGVYYHSMLTDAVARHDEEAAREIMYSHGKHQIEVRPTRASLEVQD